MKINTISKAMMLSAALLLVISIFLPIWRIELSAPQYPEGLAMQIFTHKLGGDVEIINGLNHYIGMATLHSENFIEFTVLPYIIGFFVLLILFSAYKGTYQWLRIALVSFALFGIVAMIDFYKWEYEYGHNLDPTAAIIVPGMAYQPPLIGFKQLLNFGAYSIPDWGGWLFIIAGLLLLAAFIIEWKKNKKSNLPLKNLATVSFFALILSCVPKSGQPIAIHRDKCAYCQMTISVAEFASQGITTKGRVYNFDDLSCLLSYKKEHPTPEINQIYIIDYSNKKEMVNAVQAYYIKHEELKSPMGGNIAGWKDQAEAEKYAQRLNSRLLHWSDLNK